MLLRSPPPPLGRRFSRRALAAGLWLALAGTGQASAAGSAPTRFLPTVSVEASVNTAAESYTYNPPGAFTFRRTTDSSGVAPGPLTVHYSVSGSATAGSDYQALDGSVSFPAGVAEVTQTVTALQDGAQEFDESVIVTLADRTGYTVGNPNRATVTITSDDRITNVVTVTASDASATEGATDTATFTFTRQNSSCQSCYTPGLVHFRVDGSATEGEDFTPLGSSLVFPDKVDTVTKTFTARKDTRREPTETVRVSLLESEDYAVGAAASATASIADAPAVDQTVNVTASDATAHENGTDSGVFTFTRSGRTTAPLTVLFRVGGSATEGQDFTALGDSVAFAAGQTTAAKSVKTRQDRHYEAEETVELTLLEGPGYGIGRADSAQVALVDDDKVYLNDTGITQCVDDTDGQQEDDVDPWLDCPVAGFPGQDAEVGRDAAHNDDTDGVAGFSYTKISNSGAALPASAELGDGPTDWACTRDNVTGLIWEAKTADGGLHDSRWWYLWFDPNPATNGGYSGRGDTVPSNEKCFEPGRCDTAKYVEDVNRTRLCGFSDWRLPTIEELSTLVMRKSQGEDMGNSRHIDPTYFPNVLYVISGYDEWWSSTPHDRDPYKAMKLDLRENYFGSIHPIRKDLQSIAVLLVR